MGWPLEENKAWVYFLLVMHLIQAVIFVIKANLLRLRFEYLTIYSSRIVVADDVTWDVSEYWGGKESNRGTVSKVEWKVGCFTSWIVFLCKFAFFFQCRGMFCRPTKVACRQRRHNLPFTKLTEAAIPQMCSFEVLRHFHWCTDNHASEG